MKKREARRILLRHRGTLAAIARECQVTPSIVTRVLTGDTDSERVLSVCIERATALAQNPVRVGEGAA